MKKISKKIALVIGASLFSIGAFAGEPKLEKLESKTITPLTLEKYKKIKKAIKLYEKERQQQPARNYREVKAKEQIKQLQSK